jgi:hypothetical protein
MKTLFIWDVFLPHKSRHGSISILQKNNLTFLLVDQYLSYKIYKLSVYLLLKRSGNLYLGKIFSIEACQMYD